MDEKKPSARGGKAAAICIAAVAVLTALFLALHVFVGGVISIFTGSVDLSGREIKDVSRLTRCVRLKELDLRDTDISDVSALASLDKLEQLDMRGSSIAAADVVALRTALPDCRIMYDVTVGGQRIEYGTADVVLDEAGVRDCIGLLLADGLRTVDITGCPLTEEIIETAVSDNCGFEWKMLLCGSETVSSEKTLTLDSPQKEDIDKLLLFKDLEKVEITGDACLEELFAVRDRLPCSDISWTVDLAGVTVGSDEMQVDISGRQVEDYDAFAEKLKYLPQLEYIDMCDCGLSNEQMGALRERYPDTKFVWKVTFGAQGVYWTVRTDITIFSTLSELHATNEWMEPLLTYCTDLVALDLGHNYLTDFTPISKLTNLRVLIIGDSSLKDISSITSLKKLNYLEMFKMGVTDISPLTELPELKDVCMGGNNLKDYRPVMQMKQLDRLWMARCGLSYEQMLEVNEALPDTQITHFVKRNLCEGWRQSDKNLAIRTAFTNWDKVERFNDWDDVVYKEGAVLKEVFKQ